MAPQLVVLGLVQQLVAQQHVQDGLRLGRLRAGPIHNHGACPGCLSLPGCLRIACASGCTS